jgi:hypothetical protein
MINRTFFRNMSGQPVLVVAADAKHVDFYILHVSSREKMGSIKRLRAVQFAARYSER